MSHMMTYLALALIFLAAVLLTVSGVAGVAPGGADPEDRAAPDASPSGGQGPEHPAIDDSSFEAHVYRDAKRKALPYRLVKPVGFAGRSRSERFPLLVFLHGLGERGTDNRAQLCYGRSFFRAAARDHGALVVVPQCPPTERWAGRRGWDKDHSLRPEATEALRLVVELIGQMEKDYPVDRDRIYVMGLSMGGFGTWELIERWPDRFAAAVPICGGGDESQAARIAGVPIWAFHGSADWVVPPERSRSMVKAIRKAGGRPKHTEYAGVGHNSWSRAFAEPKLLKWLFAQRRVVNEHRDKEDTKDL